MSKTITVKGIGKATAKLFMSKGYDVFVTYNDTPVDYSGVTAVKCDLSKVSNVERLFDTVGDIDVLVNNAGVSLVKMINDTDEKDYDLVNDINAKSYFFTCKLALK